jgi:integrase
MKTTKQERYPLTIKSGAVRVKVYRTRHRGTREGWIYQLAWHDGSQRRIRQFTDAQRAEEEGRLLADQLADGRAGRVRMTIEDADLLTSARQLAGEKGVLAALREWREGVTLSGDRVVEACREWGQAHAATAGSLVVQGAVERFMAAKERLGVDVRKAYQSRLRQFAESFPDTPLASITTPQMSDYLDRFPHATTRNSHRKNLVTFFAWCRRQGHLPAAVETAAARTDRALERPGDIEILRPEEFARALTWLHRHHPECLPAAVLAGFCGLRRDEVHRQRWEDINLAEGTLHVSGAKARTPAHRIVSLAENARAWLTLHPQRTGPVCEGLTLDRVRALLRSHVAAVPPNAFRHSYITHLMATGRTAGEVAALAGTSERHIHRHYRLPCPRAQGEAWFAIQPTGD